MTLRLIPDYDLSKHTWLGVGGKADFFAEVENEKDLISFLPYFPLFTFSKLYLKGLIVPLLSNLVEY